MTREKFRSDRGITLLTLIIAIIMMMLISGTIINSVNTGNDTQKLNNMYNDIKLLKDKIDVYYANYGDLPIIKKEYSNINNIRGLNVNDGEVFYVIDLESLDGLTLKYGADYNAYKQEQDDSKTDLYVVNEKSHNVYYVKGIKFENGIYYTLPGEYTEVKTPNIAKIETVKVDENIVTVALYAVNNESPIKTMNIYLNGKLYKTYEYNQKETKVQEETEVQLPFFEQNKIYITTITEDKNIITSNVIVVENNDKIATLDDLKKLATLVNSGTTFEGKTITQLKDIDISENSKESWTPIGENSTGNRFKGTYDGKNHKIKGLYISSNKVSTGLFGVTNNTTCIKNLTIENANVKTTTHNAGILVGKNYGRIENVKIVGGSIEVTNEQKTNTISFAGGIAGVTEGGDSYIISCSNSANVKNDTKNSYSGGIAGMTSTPTATIESCTNSGTIEIGMSLGGIVGINNGIIISCDNLANITENNQVGGIAGENNNSGRIENCNNKGNITGNSKVGGIVGYSSGGIIQGCANIGIITGNSLVDGVVGSNEGSTINNCTNTGNVVQNSAT